MPPDRRPVGVDGRFAPKPLLCALLLPALHLTALLAGCTSVPDRFYALNAVAGDRAGDRVGTPQLTPVRLTVSVPAAVDRSELILETGPNGVTIFEHERWASPLAGQVQQVLGRDLEAHRADLIVADRAVGALATVTVAVDLVRMTGRRAQPTVIEAQWRIQEVGGADRLGSAMLTAAARIDSVSGLPAAYSADLDLLAQRLAQEINRR